MSKGRNKHLSEEELQASLRDRKHLNAIMLWGGLGCLALLVLLSIIMYFGLNFILDRL